MRRLIAVKLPYRSQTVIRIEETTSYNCPASSAPRLSLCRVLIRIMKIRRKPVTMLPLLLIHLFIFHTGNAVAGGNNATEVSNVKMDPGKIILEEVIIAENGNNTRITANAVVEDPSRIANDVFSLLSKLKTYQQESSGLDQNVDQSRTVVVNVDNENDLEKLRDTIAEYEPQRIMSKKAKRKIVGAANETEDAHGIINKEPGSSMDFERVYNEILRNITGKVPHSQVNSTKTTVNPYLNRAMKNFKYTYIPRASVAGNEEGSGPNVNPLYASSTLIRRPKKLLKKYSHPSASRISEIEDVDSDEDTNDDNNESTTRPGSYEVPIDKVELKNKLLLESSSSTYADSTEKPRNNVEWIVRNPSSRIISPFVSRSSDNNTYNGFNIDNFSNKRPNLPSTTKNGLRLQLAYNTVPRPFATSQLSNATDATSVGISHQKQNSLPTGYNQVTHSPGDVIPLVLPTDLYESSVYRRAPEKRADRRYLDRTSKTILTGISPKSQIAERKTTFEQINADYGAPHKSVIGTTRSPLVIVNGPRPSSGLSDHYAITGKPAERSIGQKNPSVTYIPGQASTLYTLQQQKKPQTVYKKGFLPRIVARDNSDSEKSNLNANPRVTSYNNDASLYSSNVPLSRTLVQDYQDFKQSVSPSRAVISQQDPVTPYSTLNPITPRLLKIRPLPPAKALAPYYNSRLFVSQDTNEKLLDDESSKEKSVQNSRVNGSEIDKEIDDDKGNRASDNTQINHAPYKIYERWNGKGEKEGDRYEKPRHDYGLRNQGNKYRDEYDGKYEDYENTSDRRDEEERDADNIQENESDENKRQTHFHDYPYSNYEYDERSLEEKQSEEQSYDQREQDAEDDNRAKHDDEAESKRELIGRSKYPSNLQYNDREVRDQGKYRDRYEPKESTGDNRRKKSRQDYRHRERNDKNVAGDKEVVPRSRDQRAGRQREGNGRERNNSDDTIQHRKYYRRRVIPEKTPRREERKYEERTNDDHHRDYNRRGHNSEDQDNAENVQDHVQGESEEHAHEHKEHEEKKKPKDKKFEEGGGSQHEEEHEGHEGEKGNKGYKVWHEHEKAAKGHYDKEHASKEYDEKDGEEKKHEDEAGYHEEHHRDAKGEKVAEFGEKGEHKKGHSTKGEHSVHKKDEYEKKTEFFDEFHEGDDAEKHGGYRHEHESEKGGHEKKGHHDAAHHKEKHGKEKTYEKGGHHHEHKGHKEDEGHDHHYEHDEKHGKKEGHEHGKKWSFAKKDNGHKR